MLTKKTGGAPEKEEVVDLQERLSQIISVLQKPVLMGDRTNYVREQELVLPHAVEMT